MCRPTLHGVLWLLGAVCPAASAPARLGGQSSDRTVVVAPGAHYRAGWLHRLLLGSHYRDLWATPIAVPVLDLSRFAGGLTPSQCGGRRQTKSLRFLASGGRQYVFRSIDKDPTLALPPELRATFAREIIRDQISSAHPAAPVVVAPLLAAVGVLHAEPEIMVLPEDARLAGFDCVHAGMLGAIEERPTEGPDNDPGFAGAVDLASTKKLLELLERRATDRVDARAFLTARLLDVYIGDWDRHQDQWRWARFDEGDTHWWRPIPRDRDQAFSRMDGMLVWLAGFYQPQLVGFGDGYPSIDRLTWSGRVLDRRLLVELDRSVWDSIAAAVQARLTDSVIQAAVRRMPPALYARNGATLTGALRQRRDHLREAAGRFYRRLAAEVDIHATDQRDQLMVERLDSGRTSVSLRSHGTTYFQRTFDGRETHEVRVYLHDGDDRAVIQGSGSEGPLLRVIGGGGNDTLMNSSRAGRVHFYDDRGDNSLVGGPGTAIDRRPYEMPPVDTISLGRPRDWGSASAPLVRAAVVPDLGIVVGAGFGVTGYAFRREPYASRMRLWVNYASSAQRFQAEYLGAFRWLGRRTLVTLDARASGLDVVRFHGFGDATPAPRAGDFNKVRQQAYLVAPAVVWVPSAHTTFAIGPVLRFTQTTPEPGTLLDSLRPYGINGFHEAGLQTTLRFVATGPSGAPGQGREAHLVLGGSVYPALWDVDATFGEVHAEAAADLSTALPLEPTLALRGGGKKVFGPYPFHEAAYIGGATTVRGFAEHRFAGDGAVYGNAELRVWLFRFHWLLPTEVGVFGLTDAGRVYLSGETTDRWHSAAGGGLSLAFLNRANVLSVAAVRSVEGTRIYVRAGFAF